MKTVKVRIAVAVDTDGDWVATGSSANSDGMSLRDARGDCNIGDDCIAHWVEAELPVPESMTFAGSVANAAPNA